MGRRRNRGLESKFLRLVVWFAAVWFCACVSNVSAVDPASGDEGPQGTSNFASSSNRWHSVPVPPKVCYSTSKTADDFLLVVSTIDGAVSALDMRTSGDILWSVKSDERPLLSSSISNIQVTREGIATRLIPSLDGGLYEFDGEDIKVIPMTAESLLSSSVRLADNCVMAGGKEVASYGVDIKTGQMSFKCTTDGCKETVEAGSYAGDMLLITRSMQTVRAVDVSSGSEKWNFSVGQHELTFVPSKKDKPGIEHDESNTEYSDEDIRLESCFSADAEADAIDEDQLKHLIKVVVSDGLVIGLKPDDPNQMSWSRKFASPITKAWILHHGKLESVSLFDSKVVPFLPPFQSSYNQFQHHQNSFEPLLYVGTHKRQLYVQRQESYVNSCEKELPWNLEQEKAKSSRFTVPQVTWRPYLKNAGYQTPLFGGNKEPNIPLLGNNVKDESDDSDEESGSLAIWDDSYPFVRSNLDHCRILDVFKDRGYFLYPQYHGNEQYLQISGPPLEEGIMDVLPASLWMWWKEVVAISLISSLLVNFLTRLCYRLYWAGSLERASSNSLELKESSGSLESGDSSPLLLEDKQPSTEYKSRFADEFECIKQLGKGGFGIVFHTRNKVDEQEYAIKRIALPNSDGTAKKKMLREVRTLAMLDHIGIVRYFHSWIEDPPLGWQEERDRELSNTAGTSDDFSPTIDTTKASTDLPHQSASFPVPNSPAKRGNPVKKQPSLLSDIIPGGAGDFCFDGTLSSFSKNTSGSGEFSVHSNAEGSTDESGSFSLGGDDQKYAGGEESKDSLSVVFENSDAELSHSEGIHDTFSSRQSGLPFKNYELNKGRIHSAHVSSKTGCSEEESSSIVFADSGGSGGRNSSSQPKPGMLSDSSYGGSIDDNDSAEPEKHSDFGVHFTLSSHGHNNPCDYQKDNKEDKPQGKTQKELVPKLYLYLQMQLCRSETLKDWLMANTLNRERMVMLDMFEQIVSAVDYVHWKGLIHRDLKPSNIFFALDYTIKVGDFGLVTAAEQQPESSLLYQGLENKGSTKHTAEVGTQLYMSPEQVLKQSYDQKVDIFSLGMIFLELLMPFTTGMERVTTLQNAKKGNFPERFCRELPVESGLVKQLMSANPQKRPNASEVLEHILLKDFSPRRVNIRPRTVSGSSTCNDPFAPVES